jgi:hypothetical protein
MTNIATTKLHNELIFDALIDSPAVIATTLQTRGVIYLKNAFNERLITYCARAMKENSKDINEMLGKEVNYLPLCFTDRYLPHSPLPKTLHNIDLQSFRDPLTHSKMGKSWYFEGDRQFKSWFWDNGSRLPNILLQGMMNSALPQIYGSYFNEACVSPYEYNALHYQRADIQHLSYSFHQDGSYFTREPKQHSGLTTWIALNNCGINSPGLEVYPYKLEKIVRAPRGQPLPNMFADENEVLDLISSDQLWAPEIMAGDCLVFDNFLIHRTHISPEMTEQRNSADLRVFPVSNIPEYVKQSRGWMMNIA